MIVYVFIGVGDVCIVRVIYVGVVVELVIVVFSTCWQNVLLVIIAVDREKVRGHRVSREFLYVAVIFINFV